MSIENELPELIVGSRTQSQETIQALLSNDYEGISVQTQSDAPAEPTPVEEVVEPPVEQPAEPAQADKPTDSSASPTDTGAPDAGDEEDETAGVDDAGTPATDAGDKQQEDKKKKSGAAKHKEQKARMAARIEELERKLADISTGKPPAKEPESEIVIPEAVPEPNAEDFDNGVYDPGYVKALSKWQLGEAKREDLVQAKATRDTNAEKDAKAAADAELEAAKARWAEQVEIGKSKHEDFEAVLEQSRTMAAATPLTEAIQDSDISGLLVYHLATHPEELQRLNQLLELPKNAPATEFRKKLRLAHRELDKLEAAVSGTPVEDEEDEPEEAATGPDQTTEPARESRSTGSAPQVTEPARESRSAAPSSATPPVVAVAPPAPLKPKPEPVKAVGSRGVARPKRVQDMSAAEIHDMQDRDPDGFRKLMIASREA